MYEVKVLPEAEKVIKKWKKSNPQLFKKYQKIFHELADHPRTGIGHPEALKGGNDVTYSRILRLMTPNATPYIFQPRKREFFLKKLDWRNHLGFRFSNPLEIIPK